MRYVSTRGETPPQRFQDAVLMGLAPDGGLLVPETIPDVRAHLDAWRGLSFPELATEIITLFCDDIPRADLEALVRRSYATFDTPDVAPLVPVGDLQVLELWHGPTLAFKDVALQLLGNLFEYILDARGETLNILGATSGDTGSAAIAGTRGRRNIDVFVMYPQGRTSRIQELQMTTVPDANVHMLAIDGSFDDCQAILKSTFRDLPFKEQFHLGAVNSVNWARVLAQIVYYFHAALALRDDGGPVTFSVPTGNFGDIFAGWLAARMGLPIDRLVLATNENDILSVFFNSGVYRRGQVHFTVSPSMDIQVASNFERFLYYRLGEDPVRLAREMAAFAASGELVLDDGEAIDPLIRARAVGADETLATIRETWSSAHYLLDPHTAVGVAAGRALRTEAPLVCLATAHPAKFPESVLRAVGEDLAHHPKVDGLAELPTRSTPLPADEAVVKAFIREHARS
ncbi:MAG: threonine synthase [Pseudomonadales bacterium]|jgi:threonine synthase|nr:threonine synthase [Pseudomonadales bacterium]